MSSTSSSGLLKNVLPNDMISIMEFRELATAARESAGLMTQAIKEGSEAMKSGMKEAGDEVAGSMAKAGMWVAVGLACVAGAWAFSSYLDYLKHVNGGQPRARRPSQGKLPASEAGSSS